MSNIRRAVNPFSRVYKLADTIGLFPIRVPTPYIPNYDGVIPISVNSNFGQSCDNTMHLIFYGQGAGGTFSARIIFWNKLPGVNGQQQSQASIANGYDIWIPEVVSNVDGILGPSPCAAN